VFDNAALTLAQVCMAGFQRRVAYLQVEMRRHTANAMHVVCTALQLNKSV
jgi:hypothetical protein